jgi:tRNA-dihydrouridine synthase A
MAEDYGYDEVNLNVGCPSDRVQNGRFGACLMLEPALVADCVAAMQAAVRIPVTVKSRIGVDDHDSYPELVHFISTVAAAGCQQFIVHARKAWLSGLSPKQNREVPPLQYELVYQLKIDFPELKFILNGGVTSLTQAEQILAHVDGVMVGREAYQNPYMLAAVDRQLFAADAPELSRNEVVALLMPYIEQQLQAGLRLNTVVRHILGLFHGQYGGRAFRRHLSENATKAGADGSVLSQALTFTIHDVY